MRWIRRWWQATRPPHLCMRHEGPPPAPAPPPAGYGVRDLGAGDEAAWAHLLDANGELGPWDRQRLDLETAALVPGTQVFVEADGHLVAGAGVYERDPTTWEIGWIATHPQHRRRGLGGLVTGHAVHRARQLPPRPVYLQTEDHRLAAVRLYLRLGFRPWCRHPSHPRRWRAVAARLGPPWGEVVVSSVQERQTMPRHSNAAP